MVPTVDCDRDLLKSEGEPIIASSLLHASSRSRKAKRSRDSAKYISLDSPAAHLRTSSPTVSPVRTVKQESTRFASPTEDIKPFRLTKRARVSYEYDRDEGDVIFMGPPTPAQLASFRAQSTSKRSSSPPFTYEDLKPGDLRLDEVGGRDLRPALTLLASKAVSVRSRRCARCALGPR
jgi:hypothetical protein